MLVADINGSGTRTIAVDMDDVLSQTNRAVAECKKNRNSDYSTHFDYFLLDTGHNQRYGSSMTLDDFHCQSIMLSTLTQ